MRGTVLVALIDATFIGLGLYFLDVTMAVPLAVFIFLFAFIPLVGAVVSGALAVVVALVMKGPFVGLMVLLVVLAVQQIEGHVLQPFILGRAVRVHPLAVVLSVAVGGMVMRHRRGGGGGAAGRRHQYGGRLFAGLRARTASGRAPRERPGPARGHRPEHGSECRGGGP